jgi:hypothetical protein
MRDLIELFMKHNAEWTREQAATLLRIDSCLVQPAGVMLAGGAIRDAYFGVKPKDFDFVFYNCTSEHVLECLRQFTTRSPYAVETEFFDQYDGGDGRLIGVIKVTEWRDHVPYCMDWILYRACTRAEVLESFDHSINQFYMQYDSNFSLHIGHHGEWGVCTRNTGADCSPERVERFKEMARIADWEYVG